MVNQIHDSLDEIVGITSFDCVCSDSDSNPIVSVRVASYIDWIERIVWPNTVQKYFKCIPRKSNDITSTHMPHTSNKIDITTVTSTTKKIETKTEEATTHKVKTTVKITTAQPITIKKVEITTETYTTTKIDTTTERPTTEKVALTTGSSTTDKANIIATAEPNTQQVESSKKPAIHKVEITTEPSTSTKLPPQEETKSFEFKYILIIVSVLLLILCAVIACFQVTWCQSTKTQSVVLNVQCHM